MSDNKSDGSIVFFIGLIAGCLIGMIGMIAIYGIANNNIMVNGSNISLSTKVAVEKGIVEYDQQTGELKLIEYTK